MQSPPKSKIGLNYKSSRFLKGKLNKQKNESLCTYFGVQSNQHSQKFSNIQYQLTGIGELLSKNSRHKSHRNSNLQKAISNSNNDSKETKENSHDSPIIQDKLMDRIQGVNERKLRCLLKYQQGISF